MNLIQNFSENKKSYEIQVEELKEQIIPFMTAYMNEKGVKPENGAGLYYCLDKKKHIAVRGRENTNSPAMGYMERAHKLHCFSCGSVLDIFALASIIENKPRMGEHNYLNDNVFYLARKYNVPYKHLERELTKEELERERLYEVMKHLADYLIMHRNKDYIKSRNINDETAMAFNIGSVDSYKNFMNYLASYGFTDVEELEELGFKRNFINENKMIIMIKNDYGRFVSFVSREMKFTEKEFFKIYPWKDEYALRQIDEEKTETGNERMERIASDLNLDISEVAKYFKTPKYINGKDSPIYSKKKLFFGWSEIRKEYRETNSLYILEGYIDMITAYQKGIRNAVALGSASFTEDHFKWIEYNLKVKKVVIALDNDSTGKDRMESIAERVKNGGLNKKYLFGENIFDGKDVDEILQSHNTSDIKEIIKEFSLFEYSLKKLKSKGVFDEDVIFDSFTKMIATEEEPREREKQSKTLSKYLDSSYSVISDQVEYIRLGKKNKMIKTIKSAMEDAMDSIAKNPSEAVSIIDDVKIHAQDILEKSDVKRKNWFDMCVDNFDKIDEKMMDENNFRVNYGLEPIDALKATTGDFIVLTAKSHIGKTSVYMALVLNILMNNPNAMVYYVSTDDPVKMIRSKLIAMHAGLPTDFTSNPYHDPTYGYMKSNNQYKEQMMDSYMKSKNQLNDWVREKRLLILGVNNKVDDYDVLNSSIKEISQMNDDENKYVKVLFIDSANKITVSKSSDDNDRASFLSENLKKISENYDFITFANFELNKTQQDEKATTGKLSGSRRIILDATSVIILHQPKHELIDSATLKWNCVQYNCEAPVIVAETLKSKTSNDRTTRFLKMTPLTGKILDVAIKGQEHKEMMSKWMDDQTKYRKFGYGK